MNDLDTLRPEVREAVSDCDREHWATIDGKPTPWSIIRAELLRLVVRNAELEAKATRDQEWFNDLLTENKKAEAELAALKARIAEAPVADANVSCDAESGRCWVRATGPVNGESLNHKRVRLVVEE